MPAASPGRKDQQAQHLHTSADMLQTKQLDDVLNKVFLQLTFSFPLFSPNGFHPMLFVLGTSGNQNKPLVLGDVVYLPTVGHRDPIGVVVS